MIGITLLAAFTTFVIITILVIFYYRYNTHVEDMYEYCVYKEVQNWKPETIRIIWGIFLFSVAIFCLCAYNALKG